MNKVRKLPLVYTYFGKRLEEMTKEELIDAIKVLKDMLDLMTESARNSSKALFNAAQR